MADNALVADLGVGGATFASDQIGGIEYPRLKVTFGTDGTATDVSDSAPMPVVQTGALPAGDNNIGNVDVSTMPTITVNSHAVTNVGTFATQIDGAALTALQLIDNLVLAEDAAHSSSEPGIQMLAVRRDADTTLATSDNDYGPLQLNAAGSLKVAITAGGGSGGTALADEAAFTLASTSVTPIAGVYGATPDTLADGKAGALHMTAARGLHVYDVDSAGASARTAATATLANVAGSASSVTLQASNAARKGLVIVNDSSAILYVKFGSSASSTSFTYLMEGNGGGTVTLELPSSPAIYSGIVTGIWASATGSARMTELT